MDTERIKNMTEVLEYLQPKGYVVELRIKNVKQKTSPYWKEFAGGKGMVAGYFKNYNKLAELAVAIDENIQADAFYVTLNRTDETLYGRCAEALMANAKMTSDEDITRITNLLIDCDAVRKSGISSTEQELNEALNTAQTVKDYLSEQGWPAPLEAMSGNGAHLIYKVNLDPNNENKVLIQRCLEVLNMQYQNDKVVIDTSVGKLAQLTKLYGTFVRKGSNLPDRPHRQSRIIKIPKIPEVVKRELLIKLSESCPAEPLLDNNLQHSSENTHSSTQDFDLKGYLDHYKIEVVGIARYGDSMLYCLKQCLFNIDHDHNESAIGQKDDGTLFYQCHHTSCKGKKWSDARQRISGDDNLNQFKRVTYKDVSNALAHNQKHPVFTAHDLYAEDIKAVMYVVEKLISEGLIILAGRPKMGKSFLVLQIAIAITEGILALSKLPVRSGSVLYLALEDGKKRLKERLQKMRPGAAFSPKLHFATTWNRIDQGGIESLCDEIKKIEDLRLLIIDTLACVRPAKGEKDIYLRDYKVIHNLKRIADTFEIPVIVVTHLRKSRSEDPFDEISGSLGLTGAADTIMILDRKRNSSEAVLKITGRDIGEKNYAMNFDSDTCTWELIGDAEEVQQNKEYREIGDVITSEGGEMKVKDIIACFPDVPENTIRWRLSEMVKKGILYSEVRGIYKIPNKANNTNISNNPNKANITNNSNIANNANNTNKANNSNIQINNISSTLPYVTSNSLAAMNSLETPPMNFTPEPFGNPMEDEFIGFIGNIGIIGNNNNSDNLTMLQDSTTLYIAEDINTSPHLYSNTFAQSCNSCEHLDYDENCFNKIQLQHDIHEHNGCSFYQRRCCGDCYYYSEGHCELIDDCVQSDEYCSMKPLN